MEKMIRITAALTTLFFWTTLFASSRGASGLFVSEKTALGNINWTRMHLSAVGEAAVSRDSDTYPQDLQLAYKKAREQARQKLYLMVLDFRVDSSTTIKQLLVDNPDMRSRLQNHITRQAFERIPPYRDGDRVLTETRIQLTGNNSLYQLFPRLYPFFRIPPPTVFLYKGSYAYTGLIIDARHLPCKPSSGLRIKNEKGQILYSPSFTRRALFVTKGHLQYLPKLTSPLLSKRVGRQPLYLHAKAISGRIGSDIILFDRDGDRIVASKPLHEAMKRCKVVILCNRINKKTKPR